ncbi:unnamed protein product [Protopolystoma xenopodis]|uniref:Uncharacterized protein n=1 Tax=Protopolystoma xenopodis TaxID=117903 RepID=A0A448X0S4_9PLAT|nr:unnamed protein product [Protopolystoma xenopodis]
MPAKHLGMYLVACREYVKWSYRKPKEDCHGMKTVGLCREVLGSPLQEPQDGESKTSYAIQQSSTKGNPPPSGRGTSRIPGISLFHRNGKSCHNKSQRNSSKPGLHS